MATIKDVAEKANVSTATVSRALRNIGYIDPQTYEKVVLAATELGYIANSGAQQLRGANPKSVGVIISDIQNDYYLNLLSLLQNELNKQQINIIVMFSSENPVDEEQNFRTLIASRVRAILFTPTSNTNDKIIATAQKNGIKVIQLFRNIYPYLDSIVNDDNYGCELATKYLMQQNCKKLWLVDISYSFIEYDKVRPNRSLGFRKAIENADVAYKITHSPLIDDSYDVLKQELITVKPDGIVCATNLIGLTILQIIQDLHIDGISIVSFDNNKWLEYNHISAIQQNQSALVESIIECILTTNDKKKEVSIKPKLIIANRR